MPWGIAAAASQASLILAANGISNSTRAAVAARRVPDQETPASTARFLDLDEAAEIREPVIIGRAIDLE